jgi:hypothetical protein
MTRLTRTYINGQVTLSNEVADLTVPQHLLPKLNLKALKCTIFSPTHDMRNNRFVNSILDELDASRNEIHPDIEVLPEPPTYTGHLCSMREERPRIQEDSFLDLLITGATFR